MGKSKAVSADLISLQVYPAGYFATYIFATWLPSSAYVLDNRPHFEVLGAKYKSNDPGSEEEIWDTG